jgi:Tfp pilus assembly protein PilF
LPHDLEAQAAGLAFAAFLPPNLNLSHFVTNEPLAALFATGAFYFLLRSLANEKLSDYIALGVLLGLAMLAKFSSLLILAGVAGAVGLHLFQKSLAVVRSHQGESPLPIRWGEGSRVRGSLRLQAVPNFWRGPLAALICFLLICGWHYVRVWTNSGHLFVGNWESSSPFAWRQDPGFHVSEFYFKFGKTLVSPLFSSFHSFADGIYSTLWGDGLASGAARITSRPAWNYDWMNAGYLLAIGLTCLTLAGVIVVLAYFYRERSTQWFFVLWSLGSFAAAILFMSLRVPTYAQVKAFYGMPAIVSFAAVFAVGWKELIRKWPVLRYLMRTILLAWLACVVFAFWIRNDNPETWLVRGLYFVEEGHDSEAIESFLMAFEKDAAAAQSGRKSLSSQSNLEGHFNLGLVLDRQGQAIQAIDHYRQALQIDPDFEGALNNLAWLLATCSQASLRNGTEAVALARRACDLTQERTTIYIGTLAAAYAEAGNSAEAIASAEKAIRCAKMRGQEELVRRNGELLETYRAGKAYREPAAR